MEYIQKGLGKTVLDLHRTGDIEGIIAVGGMTGSFISLSALKLLPFGIPKLLISSVAAMPAYAKKLSEFFGVRDITVMHSVVDTVGLNPLVKFIIPTKGFSSLSVEDGALYDPDSDQAFIDGLKEHLDTEISIIEVDTHINTPEFAMCIFDALNEMM